ncbi:hypothetical protein [uncultured Desulfosarcina sp.]|uniref:hypothetical protein n=1 Tax=uncultured Desulfosarcina sp. TaxID=218289 RepID=UPI0029C7CE38|nr:hypothetical protein [uncultured Desulfosarcina sp.]
MTRNYGYGRGLIAVFCCAGLLIGAIDQTTKDALKVRHILRTIAEHPPRSDTQELSAQVTEKELNAYIAYRLTQEKEPVCDSLTLNLLDHNLVSGKIRFDAQRLNLDTLLGDRLEFDFKGLFLTRSGAARIDLVSLQLNGQPVNPQVLDFVIHTAALVYRTESSGIGDWYELPKGIKRIQVNKANAVLYY